MKTYYIFERSNEAYVEASIRPFTSCPITVSNKLDGISSITNPATGTPISYYRPVIVFECDDNTSIDQTKVAYSSSLASEVITWLRTV